METARKKETTARSIPTVTLSALWGNAVKRAFDVLASTFGLLLLSPVFCLLAFFIKRESPGPAFYRGPRLGKGGKPFGILKFRTMYETAASYAGPRLTAQGDRRITPLGQWLRDTKLNELPQLWNVLIGEMSLVGPRPEDPELARRWPREARREILSVKPGITSPASIIYREEEKMLGATHAIEDYFEVILPEKLRLDQLYVRNHHFLSDIDVIFWTLIVLLPNLREKTIPMETVYNGPLYRFAKRYFSWFVIDNMIAFAAVGVAGVFWRLGGPLHLGLGPALARAAGIALLFSLVNSWMGLGRVWWRSAPPALVLNLGFSSGLSTFLIALIDWFWPEVQHIPMGVVIVAGVLSFLAFIAVRYRERLVTGFAAQWLGRRSNRHGVGERVLIVGAGECALLAASLLRRSNLPSVFSVVGMVDDDMSKSGMTVHGYHVFGLTRRIPEIVEQQDVGVILFAIKSIEPEEQGRILRLCQETRAHVILIPDLLTSFRAN